MRRRLQIDLARGHRREPTPSEALVWSGLRSGRLAGLHFRREHPVQGTRFIADFCCVSLKMIVEVDGGYHKDRDQADQDRIREMLISELGYTFCRFTDAEVVKDLDAVLQAITATANRIGGASSDQERER